MTTASNIISMIQNNQDLEDFRQLTWSGSFPDYLELARKQPQVTRTAFQRLYEMIVSYGTEEYTEFKKRVVHYKFFDDPVDDGKDAVYGLDIHLAKLVSVFKSAAQSYGTERRVLLLHGPVGSAKSTIVRLLKKGIEAYSQTPEGALYTYSWRNPEEEGPEWIPCPMHEEPLHLIPMDFRRQVQTELNKGKNRPYKIHIDGELCPVCRYHQRHYREQSGGDWTAVIDNVQVRRMILSEKDRVGIGTFQPKDEKNQDSTELTGDINYRKIAEYGSDSDPRAFNFDGEFNIANRGIIEFIEVLKLDVAFLYDLLTASQEHKIKPKKFAQTDIDEVIIGHTNEPEYKKLQNNEFMEALRDRTIKIDVPYITKLHEEVKIYRKEYRESVIPKHIAPHTIEMAAMWAIMTRLEEPKKAQLTLMQKLKLYDGKSLPGYTEDNVRELRKEGGREGMDGISPRYVQDKVSNALVNDEVSCINPFMVLNQLESGLKHHSLIAGDDIKTRYKELLNEVKKEFESIAKNEVQRAISADKGAMDRLCGNYIDNVKAYTQKETVTNKYTGKDEEPNEQLMRSIEEKIDIPESRKDDFRREIMNFIAARSLDKKEFDFRSNERLRRALELKLFEDQKDSIRLTSLVSDVIDKETQEKIEVVKGRLIKDYGYCEVCSSDILSYVASIFARGDAK